MTAKAKMTDLVLQVRVENGTKADGKAAVKNIQPAEAGCHGSAALGCRSCGSGTAVPRPSGPAPRRHQ